MEQLIPILKLYGAALIGYGFIYFVVLRLYNNPNFKKMSFVSLIVGATLLVITIAGIVYDYIRNKIIIPFSFLQPYYAFLVMCIFMMVIIPLVFYSMGKSRHQTFRMFAYKREKQKSHKEPTIKDKIEAVYVCFIHNGNYLLRQVKVNDTNFYTSYIVNLNKNILFHDEMVLSIIENLGLKDKFEDEKILYNLAGEVTVHNNKKDLHYYCYTIELDEIPVALKDYIEISPYELMNYNLNDFDKQVLYHIVLRDYFKIELR